MAQNYDLFFSYRHKPLDTEITEKCFRFVEKYTLPKRLVAQGCHGVRRAFRDKEELSVSRILTETIDSALHSAEYLVIVCTKQTPQSEWVDREIQIFIELGKAEHIFPLLVEGTPEESFVPSLKKIPDIMDRLLDVRVPGNDSKAIMKKAGEALLTVIAAVAGCPEEELRREERLRRTKTAALRTGLSVGFFALVSTVSAFLWNRAVLYRAEAKAQQQRSMTVLEQLTYSLPDHLVSLPGTYGRVAGVLKENTMQIDHILSLSGNDPAVRAEIAANHGRLSGAYRTMGMLENAREEAIKALSEAETLSREGLDQGEALASAQNNMAFVLMAYAEYDNAIAYYEQAISLQQEIPGGEKDLAIYYANLGAALHSAGKAEEAAAALSEAVDLVDHMETGLDPEVKGTIYFRYGQVLLSGNFSEEEGLLGQAEEMLTLAVGYYENTLHTASTVAAREQYANACSELARCFMAEGKLGEADVLFERMLPMAEELASDTENVGHMLLLAQLYNNDGLLQNNLGEYAKANILYRNAARVYHDIDARLQTLETRCVYAEACANVACNAFMDGDMATAKQYFGDGFAAFESVEQELSDMYRGLYLGYRSYAKLVMDRNWEGALADAEESLQYLGSIFTYTCYGYALLFQPHDVSEEDPYQACDGIFAMLADTGDGTVNSILLDFDAMERAGMYHPHMAELKKTVLLPAVE